MVADLSDFGGPADAPLVSSEDGTYVLQSATYQVAEPAGPKTLSILIDQITSIGPYWTKLSKSVQVLPAELPDEDLLVFADGLADGWQMHTEVEQDDFGPAKEIEFYQDEARVAVNASATDAVYQGDRSLGVQTDIELAALSFPIRGFWHLNLETAEPIDASGYSALRFALRPDTELHGFGPQFNVVLNNSQAVLLNRRLMDMELNEWQVVEIPLTKHTIGG